MSKPVIAFALGLIAFMAGNCCQQPQSTECINPLNYTDTPDPDIVRVGEDYYLVTTTMYFCPMAPIMHSRDLVHWEIISYVCNDLGDNDYYTLQGDKNAYGKGQWATSLQYKDGWWYALFITNELHKTFIYRTDDIRRSGWEMVAEMDEFFHDASLLLDSDGRNYVVYGNTHLYLTEFEADLSGVKPGGTDCMIVDFDLHDSGLGAEGTRFYHIGDFYYLFEIDWPKDGIRTERVWRSPCITGPYECRTVCEGTIGGRSDGVAQGPIVQTQHGDWYGLFFQDHGAVGRILTVQPLSWKDGWPVVGKDTRPVEKLFVKLPPSGSNYLWADDEFESTTLPLVWQWNHKPLDGCWSLTERPGFLRLTTGQLASGLSNARGTLTQRTAGPYCTSQVRLDASGLKDGDFAGICAFQSNRCAFGLAKEGGQLLLRAISESVDQDGVRSTDTVLEEAWDAAAPEIYLRLRYDFVEDFVYMSWSADGTTWSEIDYAQKMIYTLDYFTGYRTGLFCYATRETGGYADFDYFRQRSNSERSK